VSVVLIAGASGLVGRAAVEHFARTGREVVALARRRPIDDHGARFVSVDLTDPSACHAALAGLDIERVVYAALYERPDLLGGWTEREQIDVNAAMLANLVEAADGPALRHVSIVQGPKAYGIHLGTTELPMREGVHERRDVPNFYWTQEDWLRERQRGRAWSWTVFRPAMVIGEAVGSAMNTIAALGVYAAVLRERGEPLHYPGWPGRVGQPTDTALLARAFDWAASAPAAANEVFNVTDGEIVAMRSLWPTIADAVGMEPGEDRPIRLVEALADADAIWDRIRERDELLAPPLAEFLGQSPQLLDFSFHLGEDALLPQGILSDVKLRRAGFHDVIDSETAFRSWFARYQRDRLLPSP